MLHHHCRRNPELQEELQIQAAVAAGDVHTVRKMLEQGYSPNGRDANGWTLLHFSAARGKERCVRVFLEHGGELSLFQLCSGSSPIPDRCQIISEATLSLYPPVSCNLCFITISVPHAQYSFWALVP